MVTAMFLCVFLSEPKLIDLVSSNDAIPVNIELFAREAEGNRFCFLDSQMRIWLFESPEDRSPTIFGGKSQGAYAIHPWVTCMWIRKDEIHVIHGMGKYLSSFDFSGKLLAREEILLEKGFPLFKTESGFMRYGTKGLWFDGRLFDENKGVHLFDDDRQFLAPCAVPFGDLVFATCRYGNYPRTPAVIFNGNSINNRWIRAPLSERESFYKRSPTEEHRARPLLHGVTVSKELGFITMTPQLESGGSNSNLILFNFIAFDMRLTSKKFAMPGFSHLSWWTHLEDDLWMAWDTRGNQFVWLEWHPFKP